MKLRAPMKAKRVKNVLLEGYYCLAGEYLPFDSNPYHSKTFHDVDVTITQEVVKTYHHADGDTHIVADIVTIEGYDPIECELVRTRYFDADGTLLIGICQDWG